jgi:hypothetical protein
VSPTHTRQKNTAQVGGVRPSWQHAMGRKLGKVNVQFVKPFYVVGENVQGSVFVEAHEELPVEKLYLKIKGKEKVKWEEHWDEPIYEMQGEGEEAQRVMVGSEHHEKEYDEKDEFFKLKIQMGGEGVIPAGQHAFPFSFNLPTHSKKGQPLGGSFKYKDGHAGFSGCREVRKLKAKIEYSAKVCVDLDDEKDLEKKVDLTIFEQPTQAIDMPQGSRQENVMLCCCINKGAVSIRAMCNKTYFAPGERGTALMYIKNESSVDIVPAVELNRFLKFKADGHHIHDQDMTKLGRAAPIKAAESGSDSDSDSETKAKPGEVEVRLDFQIPNELPSTNGRYIDCSYRIDILAEIDWAPDIEIQFPLNIFMPPMQPPVPVEDVAQYVVADAVCVVEAVPFADGTVVEVVPEASVVVESNAVVNDSNAAVEEGDPLLYPQHPGQGP